MAENISIFLKRFIYHEIVVDAFSKSHIIASSIESGSSAKSAKILKNRKYQGLVGNFHFQPVAFQTTDCCGPSTGSFVEELGRKLFEATGNPLEAVWLRQKIFLAIVRGNATNILFCLRFFSSFSSVV